MKAYDLDTGSEVADLYQTITYLPQHGYPQRVRVMLQCYSVTVSTGKLISGVKMLV